MPGWEMFDCFLLSGELFIIYKSDISHDLPVRTVDAPPFEKIKLLAIAAEVIE